MKDWTQRFVENKDIVLRKINSIDKTDGGLFVKYADRECVFLMLPSLKDVESILKKLEKISQYKTIVTLNSIENRDIVVKNWDRFVSFGNKLVIYFVNPFSKAEKIWIISPYVHNFIADMESLELGLKTMSENVEYTNEEEVNKIISS